MENNRVPKNRYNGGAATDADKQDKRYEGNTDNSWLCCACR